MSKIRIEGRRNPPFKKSPDLFSIYTKSYNDNAAKRTEKDFFDFEIPSLAKPKSTASDWLLVDTFDSPYDLYLLLQKKNKFVSISRKIDNKKDWKHQTQS